MVIADEAYVTLVTNDEYGLGALVLAYSLRNVNTTRTLAVMVTPGVSESMRAQLTSVYDVVQYVDVMDSQDAANLALLARPELGVTLTKVHAWSLTQFKKAVFLDADCLVVQNPDELFEREELSAVTDIGWPDCFNSGVFVFRPSVDTYNALIDMAEKQGSFDGGDQGLLNQFFSDWATKDISKRLSFIYNMVATIIYSYAPAYKRYGENVKIVHFLGSIKPWTTTSSPTPLNIFLELWWSIFRNQVQNTLQADLSSLVSQVHTLHLGAQLQSQGPSARVSTRSDWESGNIDYLGADSFDNIQRRLQESVQRNPPSPHVAQASGQARLQGQVATNTEATTQSISQQSGAQPARPAGVDREPSPHLSHSNAPPTQRRH